MTDNLSKSGKAPIVHPALCVGCGSCLAVCPANPNVYEIEEIALVVHPESCTACEACVEICPVQAVELGERIDG